MQSVNKEYIQTIEIKKSKFMAYLFQYDDFKRRMEEIKEMHPKARHFVYAYRYINKFDQIVENQSDDGEPKGSSGRPVLNVLRGNEIINSAVIIVRYFGGTKLGIGGLVRAYGNSVNKVLEDASFIDYQKMTQYTFKVEYSTLGKIEYLLNKYKSATWEKKFESNHVKICVKISLVVIEDFKSKLNNTIR